MARNGVLYASVGLAAFIAGSIGPALAADPNANEGDVIVVTGSVIRGTPENAALPVDVLSDEDLRNLGDPSPVELMKLLSVSDGVFGDTNQFDSRSQATEGLASVNLRGLSSSRTLVLLNSKRLVQVGQAVPFVDLNLLPLAAIGRIEILKDGAAATYGSDAIGGVVNFITRSDQEGFRASADYKFIPDTNGDWTGALSYGHKADRWRVFLAAGYQHKSELLANERDYAILPFAENPQGGWTGGGNPATFLTLGLVSNGMGGFVAAPNGPLHGDADCTALGGFFTAQNRCATQYTPFDALQEKENRGQIYGEFAFDLTDNIQFETTALYGHDIVPHYRSSPSYVLTQSPSASVGGSSSGFVVPANNPGFIQYAIEHPSEIPVGTIAALFPTLLYRPFMVGGNPLFAGNPDNLGSQVGQRTADSIRITTGFKGTLPQNIDFEATFTFHDYKRYFDGFDSFGDRVQLALRGFGGPNCDVSANTPGANGCLFLNPFGNAITGTGPANNNLDLIKWFFVKSTTHIDTKIWVGDLIFSGGTGVDLPGGEIKFGLGAQYRKNDFSIRYGDNNNLAVNPCKDTPVNGNTSCAQQTGALAFLGTNVDSQASNDVVAGYGELEFPFLDSLNLQVAARYEAYGAGTGSTFDPKATARWQVTDMFAIRGSIGTTFRGPPPQQLTPDSITTLQLIGTTFRPVDVFGNPALKPESSTNYSAGLLFGNGGFNASVDYFRYHITDVIGAEPLAGMVATLFAGSNCSDPTFAGLRSRFLFADGAGVPGAGTCSISNVSRVVTNIVNGGTQTSSGLDISANYTGEVGQGHWGAGVDATYTIAFDVGDEIVEGVVVQNAFDASGKLNFQTTVYPVPKWKGLGFVSYGQSWFDARVNLSYTKGYDDQRAQTLTGPFAPQVTLPGSPTLLQGAHIRSFFTTDFNLAIHLPHQTTATFTAINIFNRDPSFARLDYNYDPFTGNPLGRQFKVGISTAF
ncbi:MAG TPA: TonB-dependent receptor [Parvularculaceae bacterium]|nr:TonB-dependent receptor [Parvularculaceae bacterium]